MMYGKDGRWYKVRRRSVGRQLEVYRFLKTCVESRGYTPTVQEMADEVHVTGSTVAGYLRELEKAGLIRYYGPGMKMISIVKVEDFGNVT